MRKARRMLLHQQKRKAATDPEGTCGRGYRRKHGSRCAGSGSSSSDRPREHGEPTHESISRRSNASQRLLAATTLDSAHALLVVVHSETSTYSSHHVFELPTGSLHNADRVGSGVVGVSSAVRNSSIRNHLEGVSSRKNDQRGVSLSPETSIRLFKTHTHSYWQ